jgi:uncharacterized damage-inducible protein DinB
MDFIRDILVSLQEMHAEIQKTIKDLPIEALDWVPGTDMNSITVLVVHALGAEKYWLGAAGNQVPERDRDAEFKMKGITGKFLLDLIHEADLFAEQITANLANEDLDATRLSPRNNKEFRIGWCLLHAMEHTSLHLGQLHLTRQLWDQKVEA